MSGSNSALSRFAENTRYIFAWVFRGAIDVTENARMGSGSTHVRNHTNNRNVAISLLSDTYTKVSAQAASESAHAATFGNSGALVTWKEIWNPIFYFIATGCRGQFAGTFFQQVDPDGEKVGSPLKSTSAFVVCDTVMIAAGRVC
ncbi:uncharacterized protein BDW43DRAFT_305853 [Aspergillus alliaceus]|uniref:uncharacterized protein n=1 Tax=Petromyces alliaceus TaxID=209559 RepID=UPI0012A5D097|nr:uncharacterized protein BDW43DRAFT_305853 [Aspergillus alliaceus]KAB8238965.1 hypothetical protein BDW43DRAFT_305853 [Aspergillus alliaceus]